jgi:hypothetical protein
MRIARVGGEVAKDQADVLLLLRRVAATGTVRLVLDDVQPNRSAPEPASLEVAAASTVRRPGIIANMTLQANLHASMAPWGPSCCWHDPLCVL